MEPSKDHGVDADPTVQAVIAAENALAVTWQRLNALRQAAFYGGRYNSAEYDGAVLAYRNAESALRAARNAWVHRRTMHSTPVATAPASETDVGTAVSAGVVLTMPAALRQAERSRAA